MGARRKQSLTFGSGQKQFIALVSHGCGDRAEKPEDKLINKQRETMKQASRMASRQTRNSHKPPSNNSHNKSGREGGPTTTKSSSKNVGKALLYEEQQSSEEEISNSSNNRIVESTKRKSSSTFCIVGNNKKHVQSTTTILPLLMQKCDARHDDNDDGSTTSSPPNTTQDRKSIELYQPPSAGPRSNQELLHKSLALPQFGSSTKNNTVGNGSAGMVQKVTPTLCMSSGNICVLKQQTKGNSNDPAVCVWSKTYLLAILLLLVEIH